MYVCVQQFHERTEFVQYKMVNPYFLIDCEFHTAKNHVDNCRDLSLTVNIQQTDIAI